MRIFMAGGSAWKLQSLLSSEPPGVTATRTEIKDARGLRRQASYLAVLVFLIAAHVLNVSAQGAGGTLAGTVADGSGAFVPSATVVIRNVGTGIERSTPTNADGLYAAPNLIPGVYELRVTAVGFSPTVVTGIRLAIGDHREMNVVLKVGEVTDKIVVSSNQISDIQLESSAVGNVVDSHTVVDLPLNGRDWTSLTLLEPGVAQIRTQKALGIGADRPNRGLGMDITIGGNRPQGNNYRLDGVSVNDYSSGAPGSITGGVAGVDAVQEFSVIVSNAPADYGKTSGGVINAATRSGTNAFHGTAYEFARNSALDTRNRFDKLKDSSGKLVTPPFSRNLFGGSLGGPILHDRTFFFGDYEGLRQSLSSTTTITTPSAAARTGALVGGTVAVDPNVAPFLACSSSSCLFPLPNGLVSGDTGVYSFVATTPTTEDFFTTRIDHKLGTSDSLSGTYLYDRGQVSNPDTYNLKITGNKSDRHTLALEETHVLTPALLNTARLGFNRDVVIANSTLSAINPAASDNSLGFDPGRPVGVITVGSGVTQLTGGLGAIASYQFHYNSYQVYDDLYWTHKKHSLKVGFAGERILANQFTSGASPDGFFTFGSLAGFLQNQPTTFTTRLGTNISPRDLRESLYAGYIQDDYKLRRNLTVNLGLRYEMATVPTEVANQLSVLVNFSDSAPKLGSPYFSNPTYKNFAPRVGFSWDPFKTGKTTVRGGFGVYDVLPMPYQFELLTLLSAPYTLGGSTATSPGDFPTKAYAKAAAPANLRYGYVTPHPSRSYVEQWSFNVQRELVKSLTVTVGYVGSHGVRLASHTDDINDYQPMAHTSAGYLWPTVAGSGSRLFTSPSVQGQVSANAWNGTSSYHALSAEAIKRLSHGIQFQTSYTFAKSIDTGSSGIAGDTFGTSVSSTPFFDSKLRRSISDFDVRHLLVVNALWQIPGSPTLTGAAKWATSGWQVGGIFTLSSGLPFTETIGGDPLGLHSADNYAFPNRTPGCNPVNPNYRKDPLLTYVNRHCFTLPMESPAIAGQCRAFSTIPGSCANLLGNAGRNSVIGPTYNNVDFSLFKNNRIPKISEAFNLQFRWEVFNIANHANFGAPAPGATQTFTSSGAFSPVGSAGVLSTAGPSRQMQLAVKAIW
ncbi:MAG: TonB-dependent receptor [Edaphobacter sp.]